MTMTASLNVQVRSYLPGRIVRIGLLLFATLAALVPVDFVRVTQGWLYLSLASLALGATGALWVVSKKETVIVRPVIVFVLIVLCLNQVVRLNPIGFVTLWAPIVLGIGVALSVKRPLSILVWASVFLSVSMLVDLFLKDHVFGRIFGTDNYVAYSQDVFRARGIVGQPVPASMVAVALAAGAMLLSSDLRRHRNFIRAVIVLSVSVSVFASGTRSAVLCAVAMALVVLLANYIRGRSGGLKIGNIAAWATPLAAAVVLGAVTFAWNALATQRVFSFSTLSGSASLDNRNYAALVFDDWSASCRGTCKFFGSGARTLLEALSSGLGFRGFTTVDNLFLSLLWDFGISLLLGVLVFVVIAVRVLIKSPFAVNRAGAVIVLSIIFSGLFYDALYIRPVLLLFGIGIGLIGLKCTENERVDREAER